MQELIKVESSQDLLNGLDAIVQASYEATTREEFKDLLDAVGLLKGAGVGEYLLDAVWTAVLANKHAMFDTSEFALHREFKRRVLTQEILAGWVIVARNNDPRHMPDFWLQRASTLCPVEIKRDVFNDAALRQLRRYMDFYRCERGFAVAPRLVCELPADIWFVEVELAA